MIQWLAERLVSLWARALLFFENPTSCVWVDLLHNTIPVLLGLWVCRLAYLTFRGFLLGRAGTTAHPLWPQLGTSFDQAARKLIASASRRESGRILRVLNRRRIRVLPSPNAVICNVGFLRPTVLVSPRAVELLEDDELEAALAHEITHVVRSDNLRRALVEVVLVGGPVGLWWSQAHQIVVASPQTFVWLLLIGIGAGLAMRTLIYPLVAYWQERTADERAAIAVGDRLTVAAALLRASGAVASPDDTLGSSAVVSNFSFVRFPVSTRVKHLLAPPGQGLGWSGAWKHPATRAAVILAMVLVFATAHRAHAIYEEAGGRQGVLELAGVPPVTNPPIGTILSRDMTWQTFEADDGNSRMVCSVGSLDCDALDCSPTDMCETIARFASLLDK